MLNLGNTNEDCFESLLEEVERIENEGISLVRKNKLNSSRTFASDMTSFAKLCFGLGRRAERCLHDGIINESQCEYISCRIELLVGSLQNAEDRAIGERENSVEVVKRRVIPVCKEAQKRFNPCIESDEERENE